MMGYNITINCCHMHIYLLALPLKCFPWLLPQFLPVCRVPRMLCVVCCTWACLAPGLT